MNSFTDAKPAFPYRSSEASAELGLPDSPEVHLAITTVAELLLPLARLSKLDEVHQRMAVLRVASGAVLFGWPLAGAEQRARVQLDLALVEDIEVPESRISNKKVWLAEAAAQLQREGFDVQPSYQRQRTNYGWRDLSPGGCD